MKRIHLIILAVLLILVLTAGAAAASTIETYDKGQIDWEKHVITVTGYGAPPPNAPEATAQLLAMRAAKADAFRNALEVIEDVRVSSSTTVENMMITNDQIRTNVQGFVKGGQFGEPSYDFKGICTITLILPISGQSGLTSLIYDTVKSKPAPPMLPPDLAAPPAAVEAPAPAPALPFTGIIIDARAVGIKPALYPQIFDADGYLLYGPTVANTQSAEYTTIVAYSRSIESAKVMPRVGDNPLQLTATNSVKASNGETTDIILNSAASKAFRDAAAAGDILAKQAIVIIIN